MHATQAILPQGLIEEKIKEEYPFLEGAGLVWCKPEDHPFFWSIHSAKRLFFNSSFSSYHPGVKSVVRHALKKFRPPTSSDGLCLLSFTSSSFCMEADFPMYNSESKSELYKICTPHRLFQLYLGVDQHFFHSVNFFRQIIRQQICCTLMGSSFPCSIFWTVRVLSWRPHTSETTHMSSLPTYLHLYFHNKI